MPPGADGLVFLPFVDGAKRAPLVPRRRSRGFFGIASGHTRAHMAGPCSEGVAFEYPPTLELISPGRATPGRPITLVDEAEAHADAWNQIKADVTGVPIRTTAICEVRGSRGRDPA